MLRARFILHVGGPTWYVKGVRMGPQYPLITSIGNTFGNHSKKTPLRGIFPTLFSSIVSFEIKMWQKNAEEFKRAKAALYQRAFCNVPGINSNAFEWNSKLGGLVEQIFGQRKSHFQQENDFFQAINVTTRSASEGIFNVPLVSKKKIPQPQIPVGTRFSSVPTFSTEAYRDILELLFSIGRSMEQKPSLYAGKDEEALRDHFLTFLETRYDGVTATGETFNRSGKTDILLKYKDGSNLFVAECKIWTGQTGLHEAISQLFDRHLTWRDSKTALLFFVSNKDFTKVLQTIKSEAQKHPYFTRITTDSNDSSFGFEFHLPMDAQKPVLLEILAFHFDKKPLQ